ncbi:alpha/beta fold hydrolase [Streptococcus oralis]|uniref:Alpha/beta hydrolase n=1 Tax=Streptococcus oralis subsp. oralis TaxID=1891914 RepID=A0A1X1GKR0_STROR|nr:alpha/beta hydrolase [Streptococcus oralis]ORO47335.1 alpha/beta hydrolase [Streptococcus oralis subsp. oralis]ORO64068.1 alpha/beta hydrolase [Streptococcus oralis subsp. oralis]ORO72089.1 alpha/beta hydrolase [Streptococcus oralis subsp. oralis]
MIKKSVESEQGNTYYWTNENVEKPCIVMLPGLTADHRLYDKQVDEFKKDFNIIVWDCPCHGESRPYSTFNYKLVTQELEIILKTENVKSAIFIGQSLGGMIAQYYIEEHQEQAIGFISIDSVPFGNYYSKSDMFWLNQIEWLSKLYPDKMLRDFMAKGCGVSEYTQNSMKLMLSIYSKKELCHLMWIGEAAFIPENHEINLKCPVILLLGENDKVGKVSQYTREWHKREGYPLHIIKNAAHNSNQDNPDEVNDLIRKYINKWL